MTFSNILQNLRAEKQVSQQAVAEYIGVTKQAYSLYELGKRNPDNDMLYKISEYFDVSLDYLLGKSSIKNISSLGKGIKIPVLGKVQAGIPMEAVEYIIDYEEITPKMAATGEYFGLVVKGDSMEPRFVEGDVVIVRKQTTAETGDIVIALVNGDEATIKKLKHIKGGIMLVPLNPVYETMFYDKEDIEQKPVNIIGKVVELRGKF